MKYLVESQAIDTWVVYQFIRKLTTPFVDTQAYKLGIISKDGEILRKRSSLKTPQEQNAMTVFDSMIFKIKRMIEKLPGGKTKLASFSAALFLIHEEKNYLYYLQNNDILKSDFSIYMECYKLSKKDKKLFEAVEELLTKGDLLNEAFNKLNED